MHEHRISEEVASTHRNRNPHPHPHHEPNPSRNPSPSQSPGPQRDRSPSHPRPKPSPDPRQEAPGLSPELVSWIVGLCDEVLGVVSTVPPSIP